MDFVGEKIYKCGDSLSKIYKCGEVVWSANTEPVYSAMPFTLEIISGGTIVFSSYSDSGDSHCSVEYSINDGDWTEVQTSKAGASINVSAGDKVEIKGKTFVSNYNRNLLFRKSTALFSVKGNIMSLVSGTGFENLTILTETRAFYNLFSGTTGLVDAGNLILPAITLSENCYGGMFLGCTALTTAPVLPATTLVTQCYYQMFCNCTSLTTAPVLPATTLAKGCYQQMFKGCTNLTTVPVLPATSLAESCYTAMFLGCTSLTGVPSNYLPATALIKYCYYGMFNSCTSLTTAPQLPATTLADNCYGTMFNGCTSLTSAPELSALTLAPSCYSSMFSGCTSLTYIKCLATDISATFCISNWVNGVSSTGTFVKNPSMNDWTRGVSGIPDGWTIE